jgi:hypothetical protein
MMKTQKKTRTKMEEKRRKHVTVGEVFVVEFDAR